MKHFLLRCRLKHIRHDGRITFSSWGDNKWQLANWGGIAYSSIIKLWQWLLIQLVLLRFTMISKCAFFSSSSKGVNVLCLLNLWLHTHRKNIRTKTTGFVNCRNWIEVAAAAGPLRLLRCCCCCCLIPGGWGRIRSTVWPWRSLIAGRAWPWEHWPPSLPPPPRPWPPRWRSHHP